MKGKAKFSLFILLALALVLVLVPASAAEVEEEEIRGVQVDILGEGSVQASWNDEEVNVEAGDIVSVEKGTELTLEADPAKGWIFWGWTQLTTSPTVTIPVEEDMATIAIFGEGKLELADLDIAGQGNEAAVQLGEEVEVSLTVENVYEETEEFYIIFEMFLADGETKVLEEGPVELEPGETQEINFDLGTTSEKSLGENHLINVFGLDYSYEEIEKAAEEGASPFISGILEGNLSVKEELPDTGAEEVVMYIDELNYEVDGAEEDMDVEPFIEEGRTFVPVRPIAEAFAAEASYGPEDAKVEWVTLEREDVEINIKIGETEMEVFRNDAAEAITMEEEETARIVEGRTFLPFRAIAEAFGAEVDYEQDPDTGYVTKVWFTQDL